MLLLLDLVLVLADKISGGEDLSMSNKQLVLLPSTAGWHGPLDRTILSPDTYWY